MWEFLKSVGRKYHNHLCKYNKGGWCNCGEFGKSKKKAREGITGAGEDLFARGKMTPEELEQYEGSFDIGKILQQIMQYQMGMGDKPGGYLSPEEQYQIHGRKINQLLFKRLYSLHS